MNRCILRHLQASIWIAYVINPTLTLAQDTRGTDSQYWGPWTSWSVCSQSCGSGLAYRIRHCHRSDRVRCTGSHKQHQVCNRQECPGGQEDYRTAECRKYNRNFYGGRRYEWEAFINPYSRCELSCKARHHRYYARFQSTVQDGTKCKPDVDAVCLAGKCLDIGCDGVVGSGAIVDQCGICGGDGSTCRVISGIFTRTRLRQYGYHHVTTIPTGACNINITELDRSRNYLALTTRDGASIVNGGKQLRAAGHYSGAGTTFDYRRRSGLWCPGACIFADGPLTEPVHVQVLYYDRNPGIMYHFTVPQNTAAAVMQAANSTHNHHQHHHQQYNTNNSGNLSQNPKQSSGTSNQLSPLAKPDTAIKTHSATKRDKKHRKRTHKGLSSHTIKNKPSREKVASIIRAPTTSTTTNRATSSLKDDPSLTREELSPGGQLRRAKTDRTSPVKKSKAESPLQPRPSAIPNVASAPQYVPPEEEGAPIEYRHYYHVGSDDYRRHSERTQGGFAALGSSSQGSNRNNVVGGGAAGAEALRRPNFIPATTHAQKRWRSGNDAVSNELNEVGDVPLAVPASGYFVWAISGFSSCSRPCGGGTQQTVVVCMKSDTRVVVMAENCDLNARPSPTTVECNTQPCDAEWTEEDWNECSVTCGHGVQTRTVECKQRISPTLHLSVSADRCSETKPPVTQFCRRPPCYQWRLSNWTTCSTNCGLGERTRTTSCINGEGQEVGDSYCSQDKPRLSEICDMGSCAKGWYYTRWTRKCSPKCGGKTYKTRKVHCASEDGGALPADKCPASLKPRSRKSCGTAQPCGGKWFAGPWSECNATCGEAWRSRDVVCMKKHGRRLWGIVGKENCLRKERPSTRELCTQLLPCQPDWYMTHWSQCSQSCGTGSKTREVKCLDPSLKPSPSCRGKRKPQERRPCNKHACTDTNNPTTAPHHRQHSNDYDARPRQEATPQRYQESTSPNTTYQHYYKNRTRKPMALQAVAPAEINVQQDVRSALGDDGDLTKHRKRKHHHRHHHHQVVSNPDSVQQTTDSYNEVEQTTESTDITTSLRSEPKSKSPRLSAADAQCTDKPSVRWCLFVSQARLCGYSHYKAQCCQTCDKYDLHH